MWRLLFIGAAWLAATAIGTVRGGAQDNFYAGKTVTIVSFGGAGNNYDTYARMLSRHLGKYIPGQPQFVVANMPGVPDDRVEILRKAISSVVQDPGFQFEVEKFRLDTGFVPGAAVETLVREVLATPPEIVRDAQTVMKIQ